MDYQISGEGHGEDRTVTTDLGCIMDTFLWGAVLSQLEQRFGLATTRARAVWHLTNPVTRKLVAHTVGVRLNLQQGREPLELDGLVTA